VAQAAYRKSEAALDAAIFVDPSDRGLRTQLKTLLRSRLRLAERARQHDLEAEVITRLEEMGRADKSKRAPEEETATLVPVGDFSHGMELEIGRYERSPSGRIALGSLMPLHASEHSFSPGSYLLVLRRRGCDVVRIPTVLAPGQRRTVNLPSRSFCHVPAGFVLVLEGPSLTGSEEESVRRGLDDAPLHEIRLPSFVIGRFEVTFGSYIEWLDSLNPLEREKRRPKSYGDPSAIELERSGEGRWSLTLRPRIQVYHASWGQPLQYANRVQHALQDWRLFPVTGVSFDDAVAYAAWLRSTRRLKGARICRDVEWEKAARGADGRVFTTGQRLDPDDANFGPTHGGTDLAIGPDEVGSHLGSTSPFGVDDLHGNAYEMVATSRWDQQAAIVGGSWDRDQVQQRLDDRFKHVTTARNAQFGFRICADATAAGEP